MDEWGSYNWLDNPIYEYRRIIHVHGQHDFRFGNLIKVLIKETIEIFYENLLFKI